MPVESVDPASWRQGLRKTGIVLVPSKSEKSMVRHFYVQECILGVQHNKLRMGVGAKDAWFKSLQCAHFFFLYLHHNFPCDMKCVVWFCKANLWKGSLFTLKDLDSYIFALRH